MAAVESSNDTELSLVEFLSRRARHSSDARLALDAGIGLAGAVGAAIWHGPGWYVLTSAAICFFAYGAWGIADRELQERRAAARTGVQGLQAVRVVATVIGATAAVTTVLTTMAVLFGRIIS